MPNTAFEDLIRKNFLNLDDFRIIINQRLFGGKESFVFAGNNYNWEEIYPQLIGWFYSEYSDDYEKTFDVSKTPLNIKTPEEILLSNFLVIINKKVKEQEEIEGRNLPSPEQLKEWQEALYEHEQWMEILSSIDGAEKLQQLKDSGLGPKELAGEIGNYKAFQNKIIEILKQETGIEDPRVLGLLAEQINREMVLHHKNLGDKYDPKDSFFIWKSLENFCIENPQYAKFFPAEIRASLAKAVAEEIEPFDPKNMADVHSRISAGLSVLPTDKILASQVRRQTGLSLQRAKEVAEKIGRLVEEKAVSSLQEAREVVYNSLSLNDLTAVQSAGGSLETAVNNLSSLTNFFSEAVPAKNIKKQWNEFVFSKKTHRLARRFETSPLVLKLYRMGFKKEEIGAVFEQWQEMGIEIGSKEQVSRFLKDFDRLKEKTEKQGVFSFTKNRVLRQRKKARKKGLFKSLGKEPWVLFASAKTSKQAKKAGVNVLALKFYKQGLDLEDIKKRIGYWNGLGIEIVDPKMFDSALRGFEEIEEKIDKNKVGWFLKQRLVGARKKEKINALFLALDPLHNDFFSPFALRKSKFFKQRLEAVDKYLKFLQKEKPRGWRVAVARWKLYKKFGAHVALENFTPKRMLGSLIIGAGKRFGKKGLESTGRTFAKYGLGGVIKKATGGVFAKYSIKRAFKKGAALFAKSVLGLGTGGVGTVVAVAGAAVDGAKAVGRRLFTKKGRDNLKKFFKPIRNFFGSAALGLYKLISMLPTAFSLGSIGATVGLFIGGPVGAGIGFGIGFGIGAIIDKSIGFFKGIGSSLGLGGGTAAGGGLGAAGASGIGAGAPLSAAGAGAPLAGAGTALAGIGTGLSAATASAASAISGVLASIGPAIAVPATVAAGTGLTIFNLMVVQSSFLVPDEEEAGKSFIETEQSDYIRVTKNVNQSSIENGHLPLEITYTISVEAIDEIINNIQVSNSTTVTSKDGAITIDQDINGEPIDEFIAPAQLEPNVSSWTKSYTVLATNDFQDSRVADTVTVTADVPSLDLSSEVSQSIAEVTIGSPPTGIIFECPGAGSEVLVEAGGYPVEKILLTNGRPGGCIDPTMIVIHWSGGWSSNDVTRRTLEQRNRSCQIGTDQDGSVQQWQQLWEEMAEFAWCVGGNWNLYSVNNEMVGAWFDTNPPSEAEIDSAVKSTCWYMKQYNIPWTQIFGHYQLWSEKSDPGEKFLNEVFIPRVREACGD